MKYIHIKNRIFFLICVAFLWFSALLLLIISLHYPDVLSTSIVELLSIVLDLEAIAQN